MNPSEALRTDWRLYYNHTFMQCDEGVMMVTCGGGRGFEEGGFARVLINEQVQAVARADEIQIFHDEAEEEAPAEEERMVRVDENVDFFGRLKANGPEIPMRADKLRIWWPRAGAYNAVGFAQYIGRRARRSMKKSAAMEHYYAVWSGGAARVGRSANIWTMTTGPNHLPMESSIEVMNLGGMSSIAISRHIILSAVSPDLFEVIYMGNSVGMLTNGKLSLDFPELPLSKMCEVELHGVMQ